MGSIRHMVFNIAQVCSESLSEAACVEWAALVALWCPNWAEAFPMWFQWLMVMWSAPASRPTWIVLRDGRSCFIMWERPFRRTRRAATNNVKMCQARLFSGQSHPWNFGELGSTWSVHGRRNFAQSLCCLRRRLAQLRRGQTFLAVLLDHDLIKTVQLDLDCTANLLVEFATSYKLLVTLHPRWTVSFPGMSRWSVI